MNLLMNNDWKFLWRGHPVQLYRPYLMPPHHSPVGCWGLVFPQAAPPSMSHVSWAHAKARTKLVTPIVLLILWRFLHKQSTGLVASIALLALCSAPAP